MDFSVPEGDGMQRYVVEWEDSRGEEQQVPYDYWHDAVKHYFHLKDLGRKVQLMIMALPLPHTKKENNND